MNILRGGCIRLLAFGLSLSLACQGLARKYSCEQVRAVRPGMLEDEVLRLLEQPVSRSDKERRPGSWDPVSGVVWSYHVAKESRPLLRRDLLEVGFVDGRVILVHASRTNLPTSPRPEGQGYPNKLRDTIW